MCAGFLKNSIQFFTKQAFFYFFLPKSVLSCRMRNLWFISSLFQRSLFSGNSALAIMSVGMRHSLTPSISHY